jgi:hypothetical protein
MTKFIYCYEGCHYENNQRKRIVSRFRRNKKGKKLIPFDFGFLWGVFDMNNEYKEVFLNLSDVTNFYQCGTQITT